MSNPTNLDKARAALILDQPFFASIMLSMPMVADEKVKTMSTNGKGIKYNPKWTEALTLSETVFVLAHETMHCVFQHMHTRGNRSPNRWNQAGDYIINNLLVAERVGTMPKGGLHNPQLVDDGKGSSQGVYDLLPEESEGNGPGTSGGAMDDVQDAGQDPAEIKQAQAEMEVTIVQATNAAKMCGKLSKGIERLVSELVRPKCDWREVLRRFLSEKAKLELSYAKPKRRFLADDINLPSLTGEKLGMIAVAVDCSGSIIPKVIADFAAEIGSIKEDTAPAGLKVLYFDSKISHIEDYGPEDTLNIRPHGGGGTAFSPIFAHLNALEEPPIACVVLTDLCCSDFGAPPDYPVLWASTDPGSAPFGEVMRIEQD